MRCVEIPLTLDVNMYDTYILDGTTYRYIFNRRCEELDEGKVVMSFKEVNGAFSEDKIPHYIDKERVGTMRWTENNIRWMNQGGRKLYKIVKQKFYLDI